MPLVLFLLTLIGEVMLVSAPWFILDEDWNISRGPFKPELLDDHIILSLTGCLFQSWVYGQCFTISDSNSSKHCQILLEIWSGISSFLISDGCCSTLERFPGYSSVKKMRGPMVAVSHLVKDPELVIQRSAWSGSSLQFERFGCLHLPAHLVKCRHYLRSWGSKNVFGNHWKSPTDFIAAPLGLQKQESYAFT